MSKKRRYLSALLMTGAMSASLFTNAFAAKQSADLSWQRLSNEADAAISEQKFGDAEQLLRRALATMPADKLHDESRSHTLLKLANTLTLNNQTSDAEIYYNKLLALEEQHHGADSQHIVPALLALGSIQESAGDHTTAMRYYRRAMQINERNYGPYSPAVADSLHRMGRASWKAGNQTEASSHYKRSIGILLQQPGLGASDDLMRVMNDYADKMKGNDNSNKDLLTDFKQEILTSKTFNPGQHPLETTGNKRKKNSFRAADIISGNQNALSPARNSQLATNLAPIGSNAPAVTLPRIQPEDMVPNTVPSASATTPNLAGQNGATSFSQQDQIRLNAIKDAQTNLDPEINMRGIRTPIASATLSPAYSVLNSSLNRQTRYGQSTQNLERAIAADVDALGPNHPTVANDLTALAQVKIADGKYAEGRDLLYKALPIYDKVYGMNNTLTISAVASLAYAESQCGNYDTAFALYRKALASGQTVLGPNNLETARILNEMAHLYYAQGKLAEARTFYEWAVASTQAAVGDHDSLLAACLKDYAQVLRSMGKETEANAAETRAQQITASASLPNSGNQ